MPVYPSVHKVSSISMNFGLLVEVDEWRTLACSMSRSKVKVTSPSRLQSWKSAIFKSYLLHHLQWELAT